MIISHGDLEPKAPQGEDLVAVSIAISLKRIADALDIVPRLIRELSIDLEVPSAVREVMKRLVGPQ